MSLKTMKQKVFIVDQTFQDNLSSKHPPNFIDFSPEPTPAPRVNVIKLLRDLANITVWPSQRSGLFIFTLDKANTRFTFSWWSVPTLTAFLRLFVVVGLSIYVNWNEALVHERFGIDNGDDSTLGVTEMILSTTMFCSDFIGIVLFWKHRKRMETYMNLFEENLVTFVEDLKDHSWIPSWFEKARNEEKWLVRGINLSTYIATVILIKPDLLKILMLLRGKGNEKGESWLDWNTWSFPVFAFSWFIILFRRLHFRVLIMSMIRSLQVGFSALKEHVKEFAKDKSFGAGGSEDVKTKSLKNDEDVEGRGEEKAMMEITVTDYVRDVTLNRILEKYRAMETLLETFNELCAAHLLIGIVSMVVVLLMALFHFFVEVNYRMRWAAPIFAIEAGVYIWVLLSLGTAATEMASEADACITALRDVPLGAINPTLKQKILLHFQHAMAVPLAVSPGYFFSLNRKMLTSVAGTLTTYLIVLIQFQTNERSSSTSTTLASNTNPSRSEGHTIT